MSRQIYIAAGLLALVAASLAGPGLQGRELAAAAPHLSRSQAVKEALEHNPSIAAAREQVAEAKAGIAIWQEVFLRDQLLPSAR
jgi:outer membrane protein TolC